MEETKDMREEMTLSVHTLALMKMGDETEHHILLRNEKELKCPFATRVMMPITQETSIQTSPDTQIQQFGLAETPCGTHCPHFAVLPHKDKEGKNSGRIVAALSCGGRGTTMLIANKKLPEKNEAKEVKMETKTEE